MPIKLTQLLYPFYRLGERFSQGVRCRITEAGWFFIATTFVLGLAGMDTNYSLHYQIFSILFAILVLALAVLFMQRRPKLLVQRTCPRFATAGVELRYTVQIRNESNRALHDVRLREWLPDALPSKAEFVHRIEPGERRRNLFDRVFVYYRWMWLVAIKRTASSQPSESLELAPQSEQRLMLNLKLMRRGILPLNRLRVLTRDPFGLFQRSRPIECSPTSLLVLPRRYPVAPLNLPGKSQHDKLGPGAAASSVGQSDEFVGLRDYRPGDPPRHIHWRTWARLNRPVVKEYEEETFPRYAIALDTLLDPDQDKEIFEEAVSVAASFVSSVDTRESMLDLLFVAGKTYCFSMGGPGTGPASEKILEVLATVQPSSESVQLDKLKQTVLLRADSISASILVFTDWCEERQSLVRDLRSHGVQCIVLVVVTKAREPDAGVHFLTVNDVSTGLASFQGGTV